MIHVVEGKIEMKKVLGIGGSPRKGGNSDIILNRLLKGVKHAGVSTEDVQLRDYQFQPCIGCERCRKDKRCTGLQDGMQLIYPRIREASGLVVVSPIYSYNMTAMNLVRKYGDWIIPYLGLYDDKAMRIASTGQAGVLFLPVLPEKFWQNEGERFSHYSYPRQCLTLFIQHPGKFHDYIGLLGETLLSVKSQYIQFSFWTLLTFLLLDVIWVIYRVLERVSRGEG